MKKRILAIFLTLVMALSLLPTAALAAASSDTVTVTFVNGTEPPVTVEVVQGASVADKMPAEPAREGYTFDGWFTASNGEGAKFVATTIVNEDMTVYSKWTKNKTPVVPQPETVTVTFKIVNGTWADGSTADKTIEIQAGSCLGTSEIPNGMIAAEGFEGGAWDKDVTGAQTESTAYTYIFTAKTPVILDKDTWRVTFESNGGTSVVSQIVVDGETVSKPADPTKSGYTFKGWYLDGEKYSFDTPGTASITLTAEWSKKSNSSSSSSRQYTLKYDTNGGKKI